MNPVWATTVAAVAAWHLAPALAREMAFCGLTPFTPADLDKTAA